jgi:hypothetical protein
MAVARPSATKLVAARRRRDGRTMVTAVEEKKAAGCQKN